MPYARHLQLATIDFMIGSTDPLPQEASLLAITAAMTSDGHRDETANVLTYILGRHPDPEQVREIIIQTHLFCGYPRALNALEAFYRAAERAEIDISKLRTEPEEGDIDTQTLLQRGSELWDNIYGKNAEKVADNAAKLSPDLALWSKLEGYGRVLSRPGIDPLMREYAVIGALIPLDVGPQLKGHVQGALNLGATREQLWTLIGTVRKLFENDRLMHKAEDVFASVLGKKPRDMSLEEERKYQW